MSAGTTTVHVPINLGPFLRALAKASEVAARAMDNMFQAVRRMVQAWERLHEVEVSGLEARLYVRAGMDPAYADEADLDRLVRLCLRKPSAVVGLGDSLFLTAHDRYRLAAAAMRGWADHHTPREYPKGVMPWHRLIGDKKVYVS